MDLTLPDPLQPLMLAATLDRPSLPADAAAEVQCQLEVWAVGDTEAARGASTHVCLVFDCSASMAGQKMTSSVAAAKTIAAALDGQNLLSLIGFQSDAHVIIDKASVAATGKDVIEQRIDGLRSILGGSTNLAAGIRAGLRTLAGAEAAAKVMIVLSDGRADEPAKAERAAVEASEAGVQLFAVGIGLGYEADHLLKLVTPSSGAVFGESDTAKVQQVFQDLMLRIGNFVATNARLTLQVAPGVRLGPVYKTSPERAALGQPGAERSELALNVCNIEHDQLYTFVCQLALPAHERGELELGHATLAYTSGGSERRRHARLSVAYNREPTQVVRPEVDLGVRAARLAAKAQELAGLQRRGDNEQIERSLRELVQDSEALGDARLHGHYRALLDKVEAGGSLPAELLNAALIAGAARDPDRPIRRPTPTPTTEIEVEDVEIEAEPEATPSVPAGTSFDLVLVAQGPQPIRLMRELREVTGLSLREVNEILQRVPSAVRQNISQAEAGQLEQRLSAVGARLEIRRRA